MKRGAPDLAAASLAALVSLTPAVALACPVCFGANDANREAFFLSTLFMSLVPLAMIGGLIGFLVLRARAVEAEGAPVAGPSDGSRDDQTSRDGQTSRDDEQRMPTTSHAEPRPAQIQTDGGAS